jgi:RHS repeat-associated protein
VYDADGNVIQKTTDGTTTTYVYDYANRLTALGVLGATTTYGYDAFGQRVLQTGTSTTTIYPFKWYSVASSTGSGAKYATTTDYVFNGDTLVATIDQQMASGVATGTAKTRYIHPDHLGSTNVVTDENGTVVQTLDYYPYGDIRISIATSTNEKRKFIGQFGDETGLDYFNARFYESSRGQFLTEDPVFWGRQTLTDPQSLNSYSYANDNPIVKEDPSGLLWQFGGRAIVGGFGTHEYQYFAPGRPDLVNYAALGIPQGTPAFTISFVNTPAGFLNAEVYYPGKANVSQQAIDDFQGHAARQAQPGRTMTVTGVNGAAEAAKINTEAAALQSYQSDTNAYPAWYQNVTGTGVNSNSGTHTLANLAGVGKQYAAFNPPGFASGNSLFLPSTSFSNRVFQLQVQVASLQQQIADLQKQQTQNAASTPQTISHYH